MGKLLSNGGGEFRAIIHLYGNEWPKLGVCDVISKGLGYYVDLSVSNE